MTKVSLVGQKISPGKYFFATRFHFANFYILFATIVTVSNTDLRGENGSAWRKQACEATAGSGGGKTMAIKYTRFTLYFYYSQFVFFWVILAILKHFQPFWTNVCLGTTKFTFSSNAPQGPRDEVDEFCLLGQNEMLCASYWTYCSVIDFL